MGSLYEVTTWILSGRGPISNPSDYPFPNWGLTISTKTSIANCGQTVPDTTVVSLVCTDSLWEHTIALPNSIIIDRP